MDLETENRLAALLMEEARRLRRESDKEGVHIYLQKPNVRGRPNSRFLTATVLGVEQANRAAEISEMWSAREKERELDAKQKLESKGNHTRMHARNGFLNKDSKLLIEENPATTNFLNKRLKNNSSCQNSQSRHENDPRNYSIHCSSSKSYSKDPYSRNDIGLQDDDIEEFLHSRVKRGRGSVGCRMDEPGPYLSSTSTDFDEQSLSTVRRVGEEPKRRILGPEKPHSTMLHATNECRSKNDHYEEKRKTKREKPESRRGKEKSKIEKQRRRDPGKHKTKYV